MDDWGIPESICEVGEIENSMALTVQDDKRVKLLLTIPAINVYSSAFITSEIDEISRFR